MYFSEQKLHFTVKNSFVREIFSTLLLRIFFVTALKIKQFEPMIKIDNNPLTYIHITDNLDATWHR